MCDNFLLDFGVWFQNMLQIKKNRSLTQAHTHTRLETDCGETMKTDKIKMILNYVCK